MTGTVGQELARFVPRLPADPRLPAGLRLTEPRPRRRLSVCLYTPSYNPSGMGAHMVDLAAELAGGALGDIDVSVLCWGTPGGQRVLEPAAAAGAETFALPHPRDPAFADTIVDVLAAHPADVFHAHVGFGLENFDGVRAARRAGVPAVVQTQHLPWKISSRRRLPDFFDAIRPVDRLIAVSEAQRATYERLGVAPELFTTVPNGIRMRGSGPGRKAARAELGLRDDQRVVLTVGRLVVMKGQRYLIDAVPELAARFPDLAVVVVGAGALEEPLRKQAAALGVEQHVRLVGHRSDARQLLDAADVFVLPSLHEGMPLAVMEAMDAALPVVATTCIGTSEVVTDGVTGTLVPPKRPAALAAALGELLDDPGLRARYGSAGRQRFLEHFTSARMARDTVAVYEDALASVSADASADLAANA